MYVKICVCVCVNARVYNNKYLEFLFNFRVLMSKVNDTILDKVKWNIPKIR